MALASQEGVCPFRVAPGNTGGVVGIIGTIIFGLIVGFVAKLLMPGKDPGGFIITILLGIVGSVVGRWLGQALGLYGPDEAAGFLMSLVGAVLLLAIYRAVTKRSA
jgi:uncharacterized membrane protein YeaQ/YmgE (transglycosylase-associated protein family)